MPYLMEHLIMILATFENWSFIQSAMYDDILYTEMVNQIHGSSKMSTYSMSTNFMSLMASKNNPQLNYLSKNLTLLRY